jgi:hypothetical protein
MFFRFYFLPKDWKGWQAQLRGNDKSDWVAIWCSGHSDTYGPFSHDQMLHLSQRFDCGNDVRVQGKGTLWFYTLYPVKGAAAPEDKSFSSSGGKPADKIPDVKPIPDAAGPAVEKMQGSLRFGFYHCVRVADTVLCRGYVRSEYTDMKRLRLSAPLTFLSDDTGRRYPAGEITFAEKTCAFCEDSVFPQTTTALSVNFPKVPANITSATLILWHTPIQNDNTLQLQLVIDK